MTKNMLSLFKGFVPTKDKICIMTFKGKNSKQLLTYEEVKDYPEYAGVLADDTILIDIDDSEQAEIAMNIIEDLQLNVAVNQTTRGKHIFAKNCGISANKTGCKLAIGLSADIKLGSKSSYAVLKYDGQERFTELDIEEGLDYQELPSFLTPVKSKTDFFGMEAGEGRNSALFSYELVLQNAGLTKEEAKETIRIINKYVLKDPLSDNELETILRDEAFAKPVFYHGKAFLHNVFGDYLMREMHIKRINQQLHVYLDGVYVSGYRYIENSMQKQLPSLKATQRTEVIKYLEVTIHDNNDTEADAKFIAFRNGIFDLEHEELLPFSPEYVITNKIPWDFNPNAYSELADVTLNKISCDDPEIRHLLEECIGYCFFRQNELSKSFILTGQGANGKSTFLDMVKTVLGRNNYVSLDLDELSEKFSTTTMFGKLANIGDDISDEFLQGKAISQFKKIVSGNDIKAENKGQDVYFFNPTVKLLFSANELPRVRSKGFKAIKRRLVIIPFNAKFSKNDPDFDSGITWKLKKQDVAEYLIQLGLQGLKRILESQGFTTSKKVQKAIDEYEKENDTILLWLDHMKDDEDADVLDVIKGYVCREDFGTVYRSYSAFCADEHALPLRKEILSKELRKRFNLDSDRPTHNGKKYTLLKMKQ